MIASTAVTGVGATVSSVPAAGGPHWMQLVVWVATALAGAGTFGLCVLRGYIELRKFLKNG